MYIAFSNKLKIYQNDNKIEDTDRIKVTDTEDGIAETYVVSDIAGYVDKLGIEGLNIAKLAKWIRYSYVDSLLKGKLRVKDNHFYIDAKPFWTFKMNGVSLEIRTNRGKGVAVWTMTAAMKLLLLHFTYIEKFNDNYRVIFRLHLKTINSAEFSVFKNIWCVYDPKNRKMYIEKLETQAIITESWINPENSLDKQMRARLSLM